MNLNIFQYGDYRRFLSDFYDNSKKANRNFSYRYFAKKAGYSSANFLYLIIKGKRNLTKDFIPKFSKAMGLNEVEQRYFETLISFNQAKNNEAKRYYLELLNSFKKEKIGTELTEKQYKYLSTWYYPVIRELVTCPFFKEDPNWIRKELNKAITAREAKEALETLINLELLKRDEKGRLLQSDMNIMTGEDVAHTAAYTFHQQMLTRAKEILATTTKSEREFSGITVALSKRQFNEVKRRIREFENNIIRHITETPDVPESVYQFNIQLFSLTNEDNGSK